MVDSGIRRIVVPFGLQRLCVPVVEVEVTTFGFGFLDRVAVGLLLLTRSGKSR